MLWAFLILAAIVGAYVAVRVVWLRTLLRNLAQALEARKPVLLDRPDPILRFIGYESLLRSGNRLIEDFQRRSLTEQSYLDQIKTTLGAIREAVLIVNEDNYVLLSNEAVRELLRISRSPMGHRLESIIQDAAFYEYVRQIKAGNQPERTEFELTIGRESVWFQANATTLPNQVHDQGTLTLFVLHEITREKRLEKIRTEFVANVSHELRTPVTIIKGFADTLIEDRDALSPAEQERFLIKIQKNTHRLNHLLEELLLLSRLESQQESLHRERHSLSQVVSEITDDFRTRLNQELHYLETNFDQRPDIVYLDTLRIRQVIENLLDNVIRHAKDFRRIHVSTTVTDQGVRCTVEDDGKGIPQKTLPHIFERFYRGDKGRSRESGGTGLGLSIVKHIVIQHGGTTFAESNPGHYTRIGFFLPFPEALAEQAVLSFIKRRAAQDTEPQTQNLETGRHG